MPRYEMTDLAAAPIVTSQPIAIKNVFGLGPNETVVQAYECDERCCGCGDRYRVTLTDARLIQRRTNSCLCTCTTVDSMLFLSDISSIKRGSRSCIRILCSLSCTDLLCCCCIFLHCCCPKGVPITLRGGYGEEDFVFSRNDLNQALLSIPIVATPHKTLVQQPQQTYAASAPPPLPPISKSRKRDLKY